MKALVVYFSRTGENSVNDQIEIIEKGFTEIVAEKIASYTGAELYKLEPQEPYPFSYKECVSRSRDEFKVAFKNPPKHIYEYDTIFLGFPIWWRSYPRIVATFLSTYTFVGKKIIPFATNEEGQFGIAEQELRSAAKGALIKDGLALKGSEVNSSDDKIQAWLKKVI